MGQDVHPRLGNIFKVALYSSPTYLFIGGVLHLALHSEITPGSARGTLWDAGDLTEDSRLRGKLPLLVCITQPSVLVCFCEFTFCLDFPEGQATPLGQALHTADP